MVVEMVLEKDCLVEEGCWFPMWEDLLSSEWMMVEEDHLLGVWRMLN